MTSVSRVDSSPIQGVYKYFVFARFNKKIQNAKTFNFAILGVDFQLYPSNFSVWRFPNFEPFWYGGTLIQISNLQQKPSFLELFDCQ